jgi:SAM-dependent methyltransferase
MSNLEKFHEDERSKWDEIAELDLRNDNMDHLKFARGDNFFLQIKRDSVMDGVTEFLKSVENKRILEIGCGTGISTALLAKNGAHVYSFDISPTSVTVAYKRAQINVYGRAILHHLNVGMSSPELLRVLKPGGKALFVEPLGMNPLLNYIRDHVPYPEKNPVGDDRPLHYDEINAWGKSYSQFWYKEVHFLGMIERAFGNTRKVRINILHKIDNLILKLFPFMGRFYRYVVIYMIK